MDVCDEEMGRKEAIGVCDEGTSIGDDKMGAIDKEVGVGDDEIGANEEEMVVGDEEEEMVVCEASPRRRRIKLVFPTPRAPTTKTVVNLVENSTLDLHSSVPAEGVTAID